VAVGTLRAVVVDVADLPQSEAFWSQMLGIEVQFSGWQGQFSRIGKMGSGSILLQLVPEKKTALKNRVHIDVTVEDVERAIRETEALGGSLVKEPGIYPSTADPVLEWAVMADPSGNEFCLIRDLRLTR
jgi:predicted enzyme related to lactoylglutathione lyase